MLADGAHERRDVGGFADDTKCAVAAFEDRADAVTYDGVVVRDHHRVRASPRGRLGHVPKASAQIRQPVGLDG